MVGERALERSDQLGTGRGVHRAPRGLRRIAAYDDHLPQVALHEPLRPELDPVEVDVEGAQVGDRPGEAGAGEGAGIPAAKREALEVGDVDRIEVGEAPANGGELGRVEYRTEKYRRRVSPRSFF